MPQWEYQVIHLNVEGGASPAAPTGPEPVQNPAATAGSSPAKPPQVFSKEYLAKEFPGFYTQNAGGQQHPALQLQTFLNGVGQQSWSLIGVFPLGPLLMMIFRRRLAAAAPETAPAATAAAATPTAAAVPDAASAPTPTAAAATATTASAAAPTAAAAVPDPTSVSQAPSGPTADLKSLLQRIEQLEQRFDPPAQA